MRSNDLKLVLLNYPKQAWDDLQVQEMFCKMVALKFRGYAGKYQGDAIPVDSTDFVANHQLICKQASNGELIPIAGCKTLTYEVCQNHNLKFPLLGLLENTQFDQQRRAIKAVLDAKPQSSVAYHSGWTIDPDIRRDRNLVTQIKDCLMGVFPHYLNEQGITDLIAIGVLKVRSDKDFGAWGYETLKLDGKPVDIVRCPAFFLEPALPIHLQTLTSAALEMASKWRSAWHSRIIIGNGNELVQKKVA